MISISDPSRVAVALVEAAVAALLLASLNATISFLLRTLIGSADFCITTPPITSPHSLVGLSPIYARSQRNDQISPVYKFNNVDQIAYKYH